MSTTTDCPCLSKKPYSACCEPYITGKASWTWFSRGGRAEENCAVGVRWGRTAPSFHSID